MKVEFLSEQMQSLLNSFAITMDQWIQLSVPFLTHSDAGKHILHIADIDDNCTIILHKYVLTVEALTCSFFPF